jgi:hypothetical protein
MDVKATGAFLEHQGFTSEQIDNYLEHFGKKGMQWGVRNAKTEGVKKSNGPGRLTPQHLRQRRVGIVAGGLVGGFIAGRMTMGRPAAVVIGAAAGATITNKLMQQHKDTKVSDIPHS